MSIFSYFTSFFYSAPVVSGDEWVIVEGKTTPAVSVVESLNVSKPLVTGVSELDQALGMFSMHFLLRLGNIPDPSFDECFVKSVNRKDRRTQMKKNQKQVLNAKIAKTLLQN